MTAQPHERTALQDLARRLAELAAAPEQEAKRQAVRALNRLAPVWPRIYCFPEGAWLECLPPDQMVCADPVLRGWETRLRMALFTHETLADDQPLDAVFNVPWSGSISGCGLEATVTGDEPGQRREYFLHPYSNLSLSSHSQLGAVHYEAPLTDRAQLEQLRDPEVRIDEATSDEWLNLAHDLFGGILEVRRRHHWWQTVGGVCQTAVRLRGMDTLMLDMVDDPEWVTAYMARLAGSHHAVLDQLETGGYLSLNNGCEWIHTGGIGCTDELPAPGYEPGRVRCRDLWGGAQSQDLVGISPKMFEELFLPHLRPIVERFGLGNYGCCEPLHDWLPALRTIGNLRRVSVSPWADVGKCAEQLGPSCIMSCKPLPTVLATARLDEPAIQRGLVETFAATRAHDCRVEIMMKDLHTVRHEPSRLRRWVELAQAARQEVYGP